MTNFIKLDTKIDTTLAYQLEIFVEYLLRLELYYSWLKFRLLQNVSNYFNNIYTIFAISLFIRCHWINIIKQRRIDICQNVDASKLRPNRMRPIVLRRNCRVRIPYHPVYVLLRSELIKTFARRVCMCIHIVHLLIYECTSVVVTLFMFHYFTKCIYIVYTPPSQRYVPRLICIQRYRVDYVNE
jgi:hypothetical protein